MEGLWFFWFLLCIGIGVFAHNKNRSGIGWFILAFIFSPLLAGVILACLKDMKVDEDISRVKMEHQHLKDRVVSNEKITDYRLNRVELDVNQVQNKTIGSSQSYKLLNNGTKLCPACAEVIKAEAIKCKHCGIMVDSIKVVDCPYCFENILANDTLCKHCKSDLSKINIDSTSLNEAVTANWNCLCGKVSQEDTCINCGRTVGAIY
jgi:hypothetical protein